MESISDNSAEIYNLDHFGVIAPLLMDKTAESILVHGLKHIIVQRSGLYEEAGQKIEKESQLDEILFDVTKFAILTSKDDILSTFLLPGGVVCQVMNQSHNNPLPIILIELPLPNTSVLDSNRQNYVGEDATKFLSMALEAGLSLIVCGDRERENILGSLTYGLKPNYTLVDIECGPRIPSNIERTFSLNYIASSGWAKMIGPDQIIPSALTYRPQCIRIGEIGDINLSAIFTQYSGQILAGIAASSLDDALNKLQSLIPNWFQQLSLDESLDRFAKRLPLLVYAFRSGVGAPIIQSVSEIGVSKGVLSGKTIYRLDQSNLRPLLLRISSDSSVGKYIAGRMHSADEWARSWVLNDKPKKRSSISRMWNRLLNNLQRIAF